MQFACKYEYNGKELQDELELNVYAYGWRDYDPAIDRFNKIDRFAEKYVDRSPYNYAANNPVYYIDVAGDSLYVTHRRGFLGLGRKETLKYENGNLFNGDGSAYTCKVKGFLNKVVTALGEITIGASSGGKIFWNSYRGSLPTTNGMQTNSSTDLAHEMFHALDSNRGLLDDRLQRGIKRSEW